MHLYMHTVQKKSSLDKELLQAGDCFCTFLAAAICQPKYHYTTKKGQPT